MSTDEPQTTVDSTVVSPFRSAPANGHGKRPRHVAHGAPEAHPSGHLDTRLHDVRTEIETLLDSREDWLRTAGGAERVRYDELCAIEKVLLASEHVLTRRQVARRGVLLVTIAKPACHLATTDDGSVRTVYVKGVIDVASAADLRDCLVSLADEGQKRISVDLAELDFMDSTGLAVLIGGLKRLRMQGGEMVLTNPSSAVTKLLKITGLNRVFTIV